ncbi:DUF1120 domain-containing protein [Pseudomonas sp. R5-89-07]|uniref:DUF1120 domain-containing protein n=1 Tax=Pseudomonas sp. R5-89-07 TaxID=658644 RepID=UPI000F58D135|nr:DUF1120 domain-containing protein [Pseudomonas sp. R5-89-07]AZF03882.1 Beta-fimbriae probable major subunit [Pseudomonas sp. R5-89-07]
MNLCPPLALMLLCLTASHAALAQTTDLQVSGLITPDACTVQLSRDGLIDHGTIAASSLDPDQYNVLVPYILEIDITCSGPMLFALMGVDNRAGSSQAPDYFYGLGMNPHAPTERLGSVALSYREPMGDGQPLQSMASRDFGASWFAETNAYPRALMGFARPGGRMPSPLTQLTTLLRIDTSINPAMYLTLDQEVPLDGSISLDLHYL